MNWGNLKSPFSLQYPYTGLKVCQCFPQLADEVLQCTDVDADLKFVVDSLRECGVKAPRVIVYCRSLKMRANLYADFHYELGVFHQDLSRYVVIDGSERLHQLTTTTSF